MTKIQDLIGNYTVFFSDLLYRMKQIGIADIYGSMGVRFNTISPGQVITPTYTKKLEVESEAKAKLSRPH